VVAVERHDVEVPGGALACFRFGDPSAERVAVAAHGITSNSRVWLATARALGERGALVGLDLRGRGSSRELPGPYGIDVHVDDLLAVLDALELERAVLVGHSLGGYVVARAGVLRPQRVRALVLVDGGLPIPGSAEIDLDEFLGPALARLKLRFADREEYRAWWRAHPAFRGGDFVAADLDAYADHDLIGADSELRSSVVEDAVRADGASLVAGTEAAYDLHVPAALLSAPRGLVDDPNPMQPMSIARPWADADPARRSATLVPDVNHYTLVFGARGSDAVANEIGRALLR
jgi:pimeloyl-ACP methyl ester carboxylesterase